MTHYKEKRKYERFDTEAKIYFYVTYDVRTKVKYRRVNQQKKTVSPSYEGISRNVSVEGLCFTSVQKLNRGDRLYLEVYLPRIKEPIKMEGEVRWSQEALPQRRAERKFETGVRLETVNGESVEKSIYHDAQYQVFWSNVLESVLGNFRILEQKRHKSLVL